MSRTLSWFSCGAASAYAAKIAVEERDADVLYCDTLAYEHPDNLRFLKDCEKWIGKEIKILKSKKYSDIYDVFDKTGWLVGIGGARCTTELKKNVRRAYEKPDDCHVFGFTSEEGHRVERFKNENPELSAYFPLYEKGITKRDCYVALHNAKIELPAMYKLGYRNNNCIGCVKGGAGYWNKIRVDFPDAFNKMAAQERKMDVAINKKYMDGKRIKIFLDELDPSAGRSIPEPDIECGVICIHEQQDIE